MGKRVRLLAANNVINLDEVGHIGEGPEPGTQVIPPPAGTTDGYVLTARTSAASGLGWEVAPGGGASTASATLTTDANTFVVEHTFDLGAGPHLVQMVLTCTATVADSESFAGDPSTGLGVIWGAAISNAAGVSPSKAITTGTVALYGTGSDVATMGTPGTELGIVNDTNLALFSAVRYLKVHLEIEDNSSFTIYAGSHHPTATVRVDLTYI